MRKKTVGCRVDRLLVGAPWVTLNDLRECCFPITAHNTAAIMSNKFAFTGAGIHRYISERKVLYCIMLLTLYGFLRIFTNYVIMYNKVTFDHVTMYFIYL